MKAEKALVKNSSVAFLTQVGTMLIAFVMQSIFVRTLGGRYVGANGLFTNILAILSFSELGIGNAAAFALYEPLKLKDQRRIDSILFFLKKAYTLIGVAILLIGLALMPFLTNFVHGEVIPFFHLYFFLFVLNSSTSYFFSYKRTFLIADQRMYITTLNVFFARVISSFLQIFCLIERNYFAFLVVQILTTLMSNYLISRKANQIYPEVFPISKQKMSESDKNVLKESSVGIIGQQIGSIIVKDTNNLFISGFVGLMATGIYSGYMLIINGILTIASQAVNSTVATLGSWSVDNETNDMKKILERHAFATWTFSYFLIFILIGVINPFMTIWLGSGYKFSLTVVGLLLFNLYFSLNRLTLLAYVQAQGLFLKTGVKSLVEAGLNFLVSMVLLMGWHMGVLGVVLATTFVNITLNIWFDPWVVYSEGLKMKIPLSYFIAYTARGLLTFVPAIVVGKLVDNNLLISNAVIDILIRALLYSIASVVIYLVFVWKSDDFIFFKRLIVGKLRKK